MTRQAAAFLTAVCCLLASQVYALGLGTLSLESSLNQPLRARIEIVDLGGVSPSDIVVQMASQQEFQRFNLERTNFLAGVSFEIERTSAGVFVVLTSSQAVREPYLSFIVDTRWPSGRILSEHTVLLDLPVFSDGQSAAEPINQPVSPAVEPQQGVVERQAVVAPDGQTAPAATEPAVSQAAEPQPESAPAASSIAARTAPVVSEAPARAGTVQIQESDTLWEIAMRVRPNQTVSIQQTMLAIQRMNPEAFANGNINRMQAGATLQIPDLSDIQSINQQQAVSEVSRQNQQADLAVQPLTAPSSGPSSQAASSRQGQLRVLTAEDAEPAGAGASATLQAENAELDAQIRALENQLALREEEVDRVLVEQAELVSRLSDLDAQIAAAVEIIRLQDQQLAQLQQLLAESAAEAAVEPSAVEVPAVAPQLTQAQPAQVTPPSFLDSVLRILSSSTMVLVIVAVLVVLLTVLLLVRRNLAATAEGLQQDFGDDLEREDIDSVLPSGSDLSRTETDAFGWDDSEDDEGLAGDESQTVTVLDPAAPLAAGMAATAISVADREETGAAAESDKTGITRDSLADWDAEIEVDEAADVAITGFGDEEFAGLAEEAAAHNADEEFSDEPVSDHKEGDEASADVLDFELDAELGQSGQDSDDLEVLDFDIDDFLDDEDDGQAAAAADDRTAAGQPGGSIGTVQVEAASDEDDHGVDFELETDLAEEPSATSSVATEDITDHGEGIEFTPGVTPASASDEEADNGSAETMAAGETPDSAGDDPIETLDFDLGKAEFDSAGSGEVDEEIADTGTEIDTLDFELNDVASIGHSDTTADQHQPENTDFAAVDFELGSEVAADAPAAEQVTEQVESVDFELEADLDTDISFDDEEDSAVADTSGIAIDFELDSDSADAAPDIEIEFDESYEESLADQEIPALDASHKETTGFGPAAPAANEDEAANIEPRQATANAGYTAAAGTLAEEQSSPGTGSATELGALDFFSADKDAALEGDDEFDFLSDDDEAATKLDLAYAYQKMGDVDGAREILEEVINEGNDAQVNEARNLMEALRK